MKVKLSNGNGCPALKTTHLLFVKRSLFVALVSFVFDANALEKQFANLLNTELLLAISYCINSRIFWKATRILFTQFLSTLTL